MSTVLGDVIISMEYNELSPSRKPRGLLIATVIAIAVGTVLYASFSNSPEVPLTEASFPTNNYYVMASHQHFNGGMSAVLQYQTGPHASIDGDSRIITPLLFVLKCETENRLRVTITDNSTSDSPRWQVPFPTYLNPGTVSTLLYDYEISDDGQPFSLNVTRVSDGRVILCILPASLQYDNTEIVWTNTLGYPVSVMGLGERVTNFPLNPGTYTLFARDNVSPWDYGQPGVGANIYGVHPFYIAMDNNGNATGGFLLNSNAMNAIVGTESVTYQTTGGIIDYWAFVGPDPESVVLQYHGLIGIPTLVPYWSLGWHQCRWGLHNTSMTQDVFDHYNNLQIPLDALWNDIDYLDNKADFTLDPVNFAGLPSLINQLHADGKHYIPILDGGIAQASQSYTDGLAQNVFIQNPYNPGQPFIGVVWPGNATWVDWFHPSAQGFWCSNLDYLRYTLNIPFDGLWLDMNEISNFCVGECFGLTPDFQMAELEFVPGGQDLNTQTVDLAASHVTGEIEFNTHSLYGTMMANATSNYFTNHLGMRPFIISRSTFPGQGTFASHWLGDNWSNWTYMEASIGGIFNFHMFGIPMVGADICGFLNNTTEELCSRWMQLGALYPFSRNHNNESAIDQYPWSFSTTLLYTSNYAIRLKYSLMNYYYSLMFESALGGGAWWKPAFFIYPGDSNLVTYATKSFMVGNALIVHPVLDQGVSVFSAYFPLDIWYDFFSGQQIQVSRSNQWITLTDTLPGVTNVHIRGGYIVPTLDGANTALSTSDLRQSPITLIIATDNALSSRGFMFLDDGISGNTLANFNWTFVEYVYEYITPQQDILSIFTPHYNYQRASGEFPYISTLKILGCIAMPQIVYMTIGNSTTVLNVQISYQSYTKVCTVGMEQYLMPDETVQITLDYFGNSEETAAQARLSRKR